MGGVGAHFLSAYFFRYRSRHLASSVVLVPQQFLEPARVTIESDLSEGKRNGCMHP